MHLVDIELMFAKFWTTADILSDNHHLNQEANRQVLNLYLNLMRNRASSRQRLVGLQQQPAVAAAGNARKSLAAAAQKAKGLRGEEKRERQERS